MILINIDFRNIIKLYKNLPNLQRNIDEATFDIAKYAQRQIRGSITAHRLIWSHNLWESTLAKRGAKGRSFVMMPKYGIWLDGRHPMWVKLKKNRLIYQWALSKGNPTIQKAALREASIRVRRHPFLEQPFIRTDNMVEELIERRLRTGGI